VSTADLRRETIHAHGIALAAIAIAGARVINERPNDWRSSLAGLRDIDWSRNNVFLWEGRALMNGRVNRSRTSVLLTAELISRTLGAQSR
jgi:DNA sulfur modification protein DndB